MIAAWRPTLGLSDWRMSVRWDEAEHLATCQAVPQYEDATISFNLARIQRDLRRHPRAVTDRWLEELVVHELVHAIIWKSSERTVTMVSRALLRAKYGLAA